MNEIREFKLRLSDTGTQLPKEIPCLFCKKLWENRLTIINDKKDILGPLCALGIKYEPIPGVTDYVCYQCVYRVNVIIDFRRLLERNINKTRANYYYSLGNKDMCRKYLVSNDVNFANSPLYTSNDYLNLLISDVRSESEPEQTADFLFSCFNDPDMYSRQYSQRRGDIVINSPSRLLEPMYETSESVLCTESGGKINVENKYTNYNNLNANQYNYKCKFCTKTYKRLYFLRKHERKHKQSLARRDSSRSTINGSYECNRCHEIFESKLRLKNHEKTHRNRIKCSYCSAEFYLRHDLELHEDTCFGEISARDDTVSVKTHYTRSRTKRPHRDINEDDGDTEDDTLYNERMRNVDVWVERVDANYDANDKVDDEDETASNYSNDSYMSVFSRVSTSTRQSTMSFTESDRSSLMNCSIAASFTYSKSKRRSKLSPSASSVCSASYMTRASMKRADRLQKLNEFVSNSNQNEFSKPNWQRIRSMAKRKNKGKLNKDEDTNPIYYCHEAKCYFFHCSLDEIMKHDMQVHLQQPLYRCRECQVRFTRLDYLHCHSMDHRGGDHQCYLCHDKFDYYFELKYHFELHSIRSHPCPVCYLSYLKEAQLANHMLEMKHFTKTNEINVERHDLFDKPSKDDVTQLSDMEEGITDGDVDTYCFYDTPQGPNMFIRKLKYERLSWKLGDVKNYHGAINRCTIEVDTAETENEVNRVGNENRTFNENLKFRNFAESPIEFNDEDRMNQDQRNISRISHLDTELPDTEPYSNLERFDLFSVDTLNDEEDAQMSSNNLDSVSLNNESSINVMKHDEQRKESSKESTQLQNIIPNIMDAPIPSYSAIFSSTSSRKKLRLLPYMDYLGPSRLPC